MNFNFAPNKFTKVSVRYKQRDNDRFCPFQIILYKTKSRSRNEQSADVI